MSKVKVTRLTNLCHFVCASKNATSQIVRIMYTIIGLHTVHSTRNFVPLKSIIKTKAEVKSRGQMH